MNNFLAVGFGGFLGAMARYSIVLISNRVWPTSSFPIATFVANMTGCLFMGFILGLIEVKSIFSPQIRLFLTMGILGGFTTYSSFANDSLQLLRMGNIPAFLINVGGQLILGLAFVAVGFYLVKFI